MYTTICCAGGNETSSPEKHQTGGSGSFFSFSVRFCTLRRQAARVPKKVPAAVKTQMVIVNALSLVVNMFRLPVETEWYYPDCSTDSTRIS
jgi:hypothetical protein